MIDLITCFELFVYDLTFRYVSAEQKKREGAKRDNEVLIQRKRNDVTIPYRVIDNPMKLQPHDWLVIFYFVQLKSL